MKMMTLGLSPGAYEDCLCWDKASRLGVPGWSYGRSGSSWGGLCLCCLGFDVRVYGTVGLVRLGATSCLLGICDSDTSHTLMVQIRFV